MTQFIEECRNKETKKYLYEALTLIEMARQKMHGIQVIYTKQLFAASAWLIRVKFTLKINQR